MYIQTEELSIEEIKRGYAKNLDMNAYECVLCGAKFALDEVYKAGERFFTAEKAAADHVECEHGGMLFALCRDGRSDTGLTDNQTELLMQMAQGTSDRETAKNMGISASTVRHQRFVFRKKVRHAKMMTAAFELAMESAKKAGASQPKIKIHKNAKMVDERYNVADDEREKILNTVFESLEPLKLKVFSAKEKKKLVALTKISECFEMGVTYKEKEINDILGDIFYDYVTLRRYLIEYGFLERKNDCSEYWKAGE